MRLAKDGASFSCSRKIESVYPAFRRRLENVCFFFFFFFSLELGNHLLRLMCLGIEYNVHNFFVGLLTD